MKRKSINNKRRNKADLYRSPEIVISHVLISSLLSFIRPFPLAGLRLANTHCSESSPKVHE